MRGRFEWVVDEPATIHGWCVWFDAELGDGVDFSNRPGQPETVFGNGFLPVRRPGRLLPGDLVTLDLRAQLVGVDYVWRWNTSVTGVGGESRWRFRQSTLLGVPLSADSLGRRASTYVPTLGDDAEVDRHVLDVMLSGASLGEIARALLTRFPHRFDRFQTALDHVADLSVRYKR